MLKGEDNNNFNYLDKLFPIWIVICLIAGFTVYFVIPFPLSLLASSTIVLLMYALLNIYKPKTMMSKFVNKNDTSNNDVNRNSQITGLFIS